MAQSERLLLDQHLPEFDVTRVHHRVIDASVERTWETVKSVDLMRVGEVWPITRALMWVRRLPDAVTRSSGQDGEPLSFDDVAATEGWVKLDEVPGRELVLGAVGKVWRPRIEWRSVSRSEFSEFAVPGYAKIAVGLSVRPYGRRRTLLSYEARTATTDEVARRRFQRYWRLIGWGAGAVMRGALELIGREAEGRLDGVEHEHA
ncbi:MAG: hypothetical protein ACR2N5_02045 [Solirubrobacterales bacterium]